MTRAQFSTIIAPLFDSYNGMVSTASVEELRRSILAWLDQHCSLTVLRPGNIAHRHVGAVISPINTWVL